MSLLYSGATCIAVGVVWGATNPLVRRGALAVEAKKARSPPPPGAGWVSREVLPYLIRRAQENADALSGAKEQRNMMLAEVRRRVLDTFPF